MLSDCRPEVEFYNAILRMRMRIKQDQKHKI